MNATPYGFRIVGSPHEDRRLVNHAAAFAGYCSCDERADVNHEAYLSAFQFGADFRERADQWGRLDVAGFDGPCWAPWLWFDIDRPDLETALRDARRLAATLDERYRLGSDDLLAFFSGSKGFHLSLPLALCGSPPPAVTFHKTARRFAEHAAELAGVLIDTGVYDRVRAFRAPNSKHPRTNQHKRRLTYDELLGLPLGRIQELAADPAPFDVPDVTRTSDRAAADWRAAADAVATDHRAKATRQPNGSPTLNRATLEFIRDGAGPGARHRRLFSAAANLAEFGCPAALAVALLEEPALDSGLAPKDVRRQIDCGLAAVPSPSLAAGDQAAAGQGAPAAVDLTPPAGDAAPVAAADPIPTKPPPGGSPGDQGPPAVDVRAALARLWNSAPAAKSAATSAPGPAPAGDGDKAKGPPLAVGAEPPPIRPPRCETHTDQTNWRDEPAPGRPGWILSTCRVCGAVVGYRPQKGGTS